MAHTEAMIAVLGVTGAMTRGLEWYRDRWFRSRCREVAVHFDDWLVDGVLLRRLVSSRRGGEVVEQMTLLDYERQTPRRRCGTWLGSRVTVKLRSRTDEGRAG